MKRLLNFGSVVVALALIAVATTSLRSHSPSDDRSAFTTGLASAKKSPAAGGVSKPPVEEFEDMSLVFSTLTKT
jgi:hypothetical protein